ncbi:MAG: hypothetical protein ACLFU6_12815 [Candidatus Hydrogenedentota bacterium]
MNPKDLREYEEFHERPGPSGDAVAVRRAEERERTRFKLSDRVSALKADLQNCLDELGAISVEAHEDDEALLERAAGLVDDAMGALRPAWPEYPSGGKDATIAELRREIERLRR